MTCDNFTMKLSLVLFLVQTLSKGNAARICLLKKQICFVVKYQSLTNVFVGKM